MIAAHLKNQEKERKEMKKITSLGWAIFCMLCININQFALAANDPESSQEEIVAVEGQDESGDNQEEKSVFSVDILIDATSRDIDKYTGAVSEEWISHQGITLTHNPSEIYFNVLSYVKEEGVMEIDALIGYSHEFKGVTFDGGVGYYAVDEDEDWLVWYAEVTLPQFAGFIPSAYVEANYGADGGRGGVFWKFGVERTFEFFGRDFTPELETGGNDGLYGYNPEFISFIRLTVSTEFEMPGDVIVVPLVAVQVGDDEEGIAGNGTLAYVGLSINF
jgi:hypothetical protein